MMIDMSQPLSSRRKRNQSRERGRKNKRAGSPRNQLLSRMWLMGHRRQKEREPRILMTTIHTRILNHPLLQVLQVWMMNAQTPKQRMKMTQLQYHLLLCAKTAMRSCMEYQHQENRNRMVLMLPQPVLMWSPQLLLAVRMKAFTLQKKWTRRLLLKTLGHTRTHSI